jgi:hypothetical protein
MDVPITESSATLAPKNQGPKPSARFWIGLLTLVQIIVCCLTINVIFLWYSKQFATTTITPIFLYFLAGFSVFVNLGVLKTSIDLKIKNMVYPKGHQVMSIGASLALLCYIVMEFLMIFYFFIVIRPYMSLEHQDYGKLIWLWHLLINVLIVLVPVQSLDFPFWTGPSTKLSLTWDPSLEFSTVSESFTLQVLPQRDNQ